MTAAVIEDVCRARARLRRFRDIERRFAGTHRLNERGESLLHHVVFSAYLEMRAAGLQAEANLLIAEMRE